MGDYAHAISGHRVPTTGQRPPGVQLALPSLTPHPHRWTVAAETHTYTDTCLQASVAVRCSISKRAVQPVTTRCCVTSACCV